LRERYLFDPRGLACLCGGCHKAFDLDLGVLSAARMSRLEAARARGRYRRFAAEFRKLKLRRIRWLATNERESARAAAWLREQLRGPRRVVAPVPPEITRALSPELIATLQRLNSVNL
jgi:hypothetical protein